MFKITLGQASAFNSPVIAKLFKDDSRVFPIKDAFRLADTVRSIQGHLTEYGKQLKKIITDNKGVIQKDGSVSHSSAEGANKAGIEINELNSVIIEIPGDLIKIKEDWPNLSLAEASILSSILNQE